MRRVENPDIAPITFAHRGARLEARENSLAAFEVALAAGATGLESDVRLAADGVPVLAHDAAMRRGVRRIRIDATQSATLADLDVPSLASLYETCGPLFELSLDLKDTAAWPEVVAIAQRFDAVERLWLCSPDLNVLGAIRAQVPEVRTVHSTRKRELVAPIERHAADLAAGGITAMNMHCTDWTGGLVSLFHRFGVLAFAWDAQEVRQLREMLRIGIDALYCDRPERMVATVAEFGSVRAHPYD